jgi:uncharacterized protein YjbJ (UPF0337 family)
VDHRVKNSLQVVSTILNLQARTAGTAAGQFYDAAARVAAIATVQQQLHKYDDVGTVALDRYQRLTVLGSEGVAIQKDPQRKPTRARGTAEYFCFWNGQLAGEFFPQQRRMNMDKDRMEGSAEQAKGKVKEVAGKALGDEKMKTEGKADQVKGKVQNAVGGLKDALKGE